MLGTGFNPWAGKSPHSAEQLSLCATATEAPLQGPWAELLRSPSVPEPALHKGSRRNRKSAHSMKWPSLITTRQKPTSNSVLMRWMNLEPIIQREVSQRKINIVYWCIYIWNLEIWYWSIYLQGSNGERDKENRFMDVGEGRKERVRCMEMAPWKLTAPCVKQAANRNLLPLCDLYDSGN